MGRHVRFATLCLALLGTGAPALAQTPAPAEAPAPVQAEAPAPAPAEAPTQAGESTRTEVPPVVDATLSPPTIEATTTEPTASPAAPAGAPALDAAEPPEDGSDWVQLTNGEWMMGEFLGMRDGDLEFDSDEFDVHTVDFVDVKRLFLRNPCEVTLESLDVLSGPALLSGETILVRTDAGAREVPRAQILSIIPAAQSELGRWSLDASLGLNLARGNSNQGTLSGSTIIMRRDSLTRLKLDYLGNYGKSNGVKSSHNHRGLAKFDLFVSRVFFITPAQLTLEFDEFKNIQLRATPAAGAGAHIIDNGRVEWDVSVAGGYQYTRYVSVQMGAPDVDNAAVLVGTILDVEATDDVDLYLEYSITMVPTDIGLTTHHLVGEIEVEITTIFDLQLRTIFDRIEQPVTDDSGVTPKRNDVQIIAGFGIELG